jgi:hypothetical protein
MKLAPPVLLMATALLCSGCGIADPYNQPHRSTAGARVQARPAASTSPRPPDDLPSTSDAPAGALEVLSRFALIYGDVTGAGAMSRAHRLALLATPGYAHRLLSTAPLARHTAARAVPAGARMAATIGALQLASVDRGLQRGTVTLLERLQFAGSAGSPVADLFQTELTRTVRGWRVSSFRALR